jgi:hypothetical protein
MKNKEKSNNYATLGSLLKNLNMKNTCKLINGILAEVWVEAQKEHN